MWERGSAGKGRFSKVPFEKGNNPLIPPLLRGNKGILIMDVSTLKVIIWPIAMVFQIPPSPFSKGGVRGMALT